MLQFEEVKQSLTDLEPELRDLADALGLEKTKEEIEKLEQEAAAPGFWDHPENTQKVLQRTSGLKNKVESYEKLCRQFDDAMALARDGRRGRGFVHSAGGPGRAGGFQKQPGGHAPDHPFSLGNTTLKTPSSPSTPVQAAPKPRTGPRCFIGCITAGASATASR